MTAKRTARAIPGEAYRFKSISSAFSPAGKATRNTGYGAAQKIRARRYYPPRPRFGVLRGQKLNFAPNCRTRGSYADVTCPKFGSVLPTSIFWNSVWLKVLKDSNRSSSLGPPSRNIKVLNKDILKLKSPGPTTASLPALPKPSFGPPFQGATGLANELALNQAVRVLG